MVPCEPLCMFVRLLGPCSSRLPPRPPPPSAWQAGIFHQVHAAWALTWKGRDQSDGEAQSETSRRSFHSISPFSFSF